MIVICLSVALLAMGALDSYLYGRIPLQNRPFNPIYKLMPLGILAFFKFRK